MTRCAYGQALAALRDGHPLPRGYEFVATAPASVMTPTERLRSHDRFCRPCSVAEDSMNPDAEHLRRRTA